MRVCGLPGEGHGALEQRNCALVIRAVDPLGIAKGGGDLLGGGRDIAHRSIGERQAHSGGERVEMGGAEDAAALLGHLLGHRDGVPSVSREPVGDGERVSGGEGAGVFIAQDTNAVGHVGPDQLETVAVPPGFDQGHPEVPGNRERVGMIGAQDGEAAIESVLKQRDGQREFTTGKISSRFVVAGGKIVNFEV